MKLYESWTWFLKIFTTCTVTSFWDNSEFLKMAGCFRKIGQSGKIMAKPKIQFQFLFRPNVWKTTTTKNIPIIFPSYWPLHELMCIRINIVTSNINLLIIFHHISMKSDENTSHFTSISTHTCRIWAINSLSYDFTFIFIYSTVSSR